MMTSTAVAASTVLAETSSPGNSFTRKCFGKSVSFRAKRYAESSPRSSPLARPVDPGSFRRPSLSKLPSTVLTGLSRSRVAPPIVVPEESRAAYAMAYKHRKKWFVVDPRHSKYAMPIWDLLGMLALAYTAILTPYEVAFLDPPKSWADAATDGMFICNRIIDVIFVCDMILQFVLIQQVIHKSEGVKWIEDPRTLACNYAKGWFLLDFLSTLPSLCDIIPLSFANQSSGSDAAAVAGGGSSDVVSRLKALRVIRCARLVKLMRLLRASRMLKRWETRMSINYAMLALCRSLIYYIVLAHWSACAMVLPTTFYSDPLQTWLGWYGYGDSPPVERYVAAFYLSLQVICGAQGGDAERDAFNTQEQLLFSFLVVVRPLCANPRRPRRP